MLYRPMGITSTRVLSLESEWCQRHTAPLRSLLREIVLWKHRRCQHPMSNPPLRRLTCLHSTQQGDTVWVCIKARIRKIKGGRGWRHKLSWSRAFSLRSRTSWFRATLLYQPLIQPNQRQAQKRPLSYSYPPTSPIEMSRCRPSHPPLAQSWHYLTMK